MLGELIWKKGQQGCFASICRVLRRAFFSVSKMAVLLVSPIWMEPMGFCLLKNSVNFFGEARNGDKPEKIVGKLEVIERRLKEMDGKLKILKDAFSVICLREQ